MLGSLWLLGSRTPREPNDESVESAAVLGSVRKQDGIEFAAGKQNNGAEVQPDEQYDDTA